MLIKLTMIDHQPFFFGLKVLSSTLKILISQEGLTVNQKYLNLQKQLQQFF